MYFKSILYVSRKDIIFSKLKKIFNKKCEHVVCCPVIKITTENVEKENYTMWTKIKSASVWLPIYCHKIALLLWHLVKVLRRH